MGQKKYQHQLSISNINDQAFLSLIEVFTLENRISNLDDFDYFIHQFYMVLKKERELFSSKNSNLHIKKIRLIHILKIQQHIQHLIVQDKLEDSKALRILNYLDSFCRFLTKKELTNIYYITPKTQRVTSPKRKLDYPILQKFEKYLEIKHYATTTKHIYRENIKYFLSFSNYQQDQHHSNDFWQQSIHQFEIHLMKEVNLEKIATSSAYGYLKAVRLFLRLLSEENQISFRYQIPKKLIQNGKRSNEYVSMQDVLLVIKKTFETSKDILRDISIIMIILETGCRPIEIENLSIDDIYFQEKLIILKSKKSHQRTLTLSETTLSIIKQYLQIRDNYLPQIDSKVLFFAASGTGIPIRSYHITHFFRKFNLKVFNEIRFTPKTLRHTFITNALNHKISIEKIRESVGHKHLTSTHYYFYRDINQMKELFNGKNLLMEAEHGN